MPPTSVADMFVPENVRTGVTADSQKDALSQIASLAVNRGYASGIDEVLQGLTAREAQMSTALMDGIAIPHAKHAAITEPALIVVRFSDPVAWPDEDHQVSVAVAMLIPEAQAGTTHLKLLAKVSRALMNEELRTTLTSAPAEDIYPPLHDRLS
ncbi:MAG: PTS sugar transporter subunit IIA [Brevibacterium aurantiacum]